MAAGHSLAGSLRFVRRSRAAWADEIALWTVPVVILFSMSFLTDINLGLRYVLAILPYIFIAAGKARPVDARALGGAGRWVMAALVAGVAGLDRSRLGLDSPSLSGLLQLGLGWA